MHLVIVGNGVAGITCALEVRARDPSCRITVISGETDHFFSRTALMYAFMDRLQRPELEPYERRVYDEKRIDRVRDWVVDLDAGARCLTLQSGKSMTYDKLVLALGARPRTGGWDGLAAVKDGLVNFVSMQDLDACERLAPLAKRAVVVGGGLIGIELVECLVHFRIPVTFLVREPWYWPVALGLEESELVAAQLLHHGVDVRFGDGLATIQTDAAGRVNGVTTTANHALPCELLGICIGVQPAIDRLRSFKSQPALAKGVLVNELLETSLPEVWACGDCAEIQFTGGRMLNETIWYSAKRQGRLVAENVLGKSARYNPPIFFNSSKFFEMEFTTVGDVMNQPDGTPSIYRRHPTRNVSQRIVHNGKRVLGFNMLGSRWNHEVLQQWIVDARSPEFVTAHLKDAQFDVEFGRFPLSAMQETSIPLKGCWGPT